ncbi:SpoIIAA family protein [Niabella ginsengisoli]|uniref:STAS/SEC14 domain-containing protein n=1 Tax=Niabella ginsengisoli TaxID=522298 RepID=A0ABS9SF89_9BACT|nr:STAS/SEC14 domain-containing protein [Niabella ginsengisoli]MCH5597027.1 STAS/SEC14 domain-containing protein [Niabella ginsengisoli]
MIDKIDKVPDNIMAFSASGTIDANDFTNILIPAIKNYMKDHKDLNYMLVLDNDLSNFSVTWWMKSLWVAIRDMTTWNRSVIISNLDKLKNFTNESCKELPGELRVYPKEQIEEAIRWLSGNINTRS